MKLRPSLHLGHSRRGRLGIRCRQGTAAMGVPPRGRDQAREGTIREIPKEAPANRTVRNPDRARELKPAWALGTQVRADPLLDPVIRVQPHILLCRRMAITMPWWWAPRLRKSTQKQRTYGPAGWCTPSIFTWARRRPGFFSTR